MTLMGLLRRWLMFRVMPVGPATFLAALGIAFLLALPFGAANDWYMYGLSIVIAALFGWAAHRRYVITVLERSDRGAVFWLHRRKDTQPAGAQAPPSSTLPSGSSLEE